MAVPKRKFAKEPVVARAAAAEAAAAESNVALLDGRPSPPLSSSRRRGRGREEEVKIQDCNNGHGPEEEEERQVVEEVASPARRRERPSRKKQASTSGGPSNKEEAEKKKGPGRPRGKKRGNGWTSVKGAKKPRKAAAKQEKKINEVSSLEAMMVDRQKGETIWKECLVKWPGHPQPTWVLEKDLAGFHEKVGIDEYLKTPDARTMVRNLNVVMNVEIQGRNVIKLPGVKRILSSSGGLLSLVFG